MSGRAGSARRWVVPLVVAVVAAIVGSVVAVVLVDRDNAAGHSHAPAAGRATSHDTSADRGARGTWIAVFPGQDSSDDGWLSRSTNGGRTWSEVAGDCSFCQFDDVELAFGKGRWVAAVGSGGGTGPNLGVTGAGLALGGTFTSDDAKTWTRTATFADPIEGVAYGDGRWMAVERSGDAHGFARDTSPSSGALFTSTDGVHWVQIPTTGLPDLESSRIAFGDGTWVISVSTCPEGTAGGVDRYGCSSTELFTSTDGKAWRSVGPRFGPYVRVAYGSGVWIANGPLLDTAKRKTAAPTVLSSRNLTTWSRTTIPQRRDGVAFAEGSAAAFGDGSWLLAAHSNDDPRTMNGESTRFFSSRDGRSWSPTGALARIVTTFAHGGTS